MLLCNKGSYESQNKSVGTCNGDLSLAKTTLQDRGALTIVHGDITKMSVDVIVNSANAGFRGGGGVDGAIHRAAGPQLALYCERFKGVSLGQAVISPAFDLPGKFVVHALPSPWSGGNNEEVETLKACCLASMELARLNGATSMAFPALAVGAYRFPKDLAARTMLEAICGYCQQHNDAPTVSIVIDDLKTVRSFRRVLAELESLGMSYPQL